MRGVFDRDFWQGFLAEVIGRGFAGFWHGICYGFRHKFWYGFWHEFLAGVPAGFLARFGYWFRFAAGIWFEVLVRDLAGVCGEVGKGLGQRFRQGFWQV